MAVDENRCDDSIIGRGLVHFVDWITRHPWLILSVCLCTIILSIHLSVTRLYSRTQRDDLMSAEKACQQRWQLYLAEFGADDYIVIVVEGNQVKSMKSALEALAGAIRKEPTQFDRLFYKVDLTSIRDRALMLMPKAQLHQLNEKLGSMGLLLGPLSPIAWRELTIENLLVQAQTALTRHFGGKPFESTDSDLFNQLQSILPTAKAHLKDSSSYRNPWGQLIEPTKDAIPLNQPQYFFSDDLTLAFLLVRPIRKEAESFTPAAEPIQTLQKILRETKPQFPELTFGLTGLPVLENDEMTASDEDSQLAAYLALAGVALLYLIVYRGIRYPLLTVSTLVLGTIWALGLTTITVGYLTILSSTFAVMLIGMGDYGVLWVARYDEERKNGSSVSEAMKLTARHAGPSILTAAITTSMAFYATMLADFQAVAELGFIAGSGVLLCALACFLFMPALLVLVDRKEAISDPQESGVIAFRSPYWMPRLSKHPILVIATSLILFLSASFLSLRLDYDHCLLRMQAQGLDSVQWELKLLERTTGSSWHALSIAKTREEALELKAKFEKLPEVARVAEVASLVPPDQEEKLSLVKGIQGKLRYLPQLEIPMDQRNPDLTSLDNSLRNLETTLKPHSNQNEWSDLYRGIVDFHREIQIQANSGTTHRLIEFNRNLAHDLLAGLHQLKEVSSAKSIIIADLPESLQERFIGNQGNWLLRIYARDNLWEYGELERFVSAIREIDPEATGKPFGTLEGLKSMKTGFQRAGLYAFLAIIGILLIDFRDWKVLLLALMPLGFGIVGTMGLLKLFGYTLNPANLIALPLIVGVGVDNGVHILHDFRSRRRDKAYRMSSATGRGILVAALTTLLGFGTLMISRHQGMSGLGLTLTLGVGICMVAALVVMPAILRVTDQIRQNRSQETKPIVKKVA
jgi:hopanoid biosynthesis associated RND transporter like protein HpnN